MGDSESSYLLMTAQTTVFLENIAIEMVFKATILKRLFSKIAIKFQI